MSDPAPLATPLAMRTPIGIDLGTTHTALAYVDLDLVDPAADDATPTVFNVPQIVAQGSLEARPLLPSFLYLAHASEGAQALPWDATRTFAVGEHARARGADAPARVVSSAKSWLCHATIDRRSACLPTTPAGVAPDADIPRLSPVEVSRRYLEHLRDAWNARLSREASGAASEESRFEQQDIVLTVPASFDAAARDLTAEAAQLAGIAHLTLLEEPQAALYSWIEQSKGSWRKQVNVGEVILVVDVGGGTTDFSAIVVQEHEGSLQLQRIAVGDHILLGGDNMDLALAYVLKAKLAAQGKELDPWQAQSLGHAARVAKEQLLSRDDLEAAPIAIASRGAKLLGGGVRTELTRAELVATLVEGFFPVVGSSAKPVVRARGGLTQLGLAYAQDAAVTRHLAAFLSKQKDALPDANAPANGRTFLHPAAILFNGGVMKGSVLRARVVDTVNAWLAAEGSAPARVLEGADLDLSVAKGAAYFAFARRGKGVRIRGGTARAYYVGIESAAPAVPGLEPPITALCVAPFGMEEGATAWVPTDAVGLVVGEPVRFRFFGSTVRRDDKPGQILDRWSADELEELAPIEATLPAEGRRAGDVVAVRLSSTATEIGTLALEAIEVASDADKSTTGARWKLELNVRSEP